MDWNAPCFNGQFTRILAADVVYEEKNWKPILALIQKHLAVGGTAIIAEPNRANADGFFDLLARYGYKTEEFGYTALLEEDPSTITVYCVRRGD
jgi:predicted nicotinamide N-methyase